MLVKMQVVVSNVRNDIDAEEFTKQVQIQINNWLKDTGPVARCDFISLDLDA